MSMLPREPQLLELPLLKVVVKKGEVAAGEDAAEVGERRTSNPPQAKTGVKLRYYLKAEFDKLSQEQQTKLIDHRKANGNYCDAWTRKKGSGTPSS